MSLDEAKSQRLRAAKILFRQAITEIGINESQNQFTSLQLMMLALYDGLVKNGIKFDFTDEELGHVERARDFKTIKEKSAAMKKAIRGAATQEELDAIDIEDWQK